MLTCMNPTRKSYRAVVYCASAAGSNPAYLEAASALGRGLAEVGIGLVYGGATVGMMGAVANAALAADGEVIGVLPSVLSSREIGHTGLTELIATDSMHQRKAKMLELADAVIALPGGFGTLDELMEAVTWAQLGIHNKPCVLINVLGYYEGLLSFLDTAVREGFLKTSNRRLILVANTVEEAIARLKSRDRVSEGLAD
jgi:uncharacterized protein (TIGR00730 family)